MYTALATGDFAVEVTLFRPLVEFHSGDPPELRPVGVRTHSPVGGDSGPGLHLNDGPGLGAMHQGHRKTDLGNEDSVLVLLQNTDDLAADGVFTTPRG